MFFVIITVIGGQHTNVDYYFNESQICPLPDCLWRLVFHLRARIVIGKTSLFNGISLFDIMLDISVILGQWV